MEASAKEFEKIFFDILNVHAPIKVFQMRMKEVIRKKNTLFKEATKQGNEEKLHKAKS